MEQNIKSAISTMAIAVVAAVASSAGVSYFLLRKPAVIIPEPKTLAIKVEMLLASDREYQGETGSPYTLVEFMDYQCPPCKRAQSLVDKALLENKGKLRYTARNLPLTMHPNALPAAIAAEAAGEQNHFWPAHDALMQSEDLKPARIHSILEKQHLDEKRYAQAVASTARSRVASDLAQAKTLGLTGTPAFLLCCPDGKVLELASLSQISQYIK